jgi:hypothetical protein
MVLFISLTSLLSAIEIKGESIGDSIDKYIADTQHTYTKTDIAMECPVMRASYIARVVRYDFTEGKTYCKVYEIDKNSDIASATAKPILIYNINHSAKDYYNSINNTDRVTIDNRLTTKWDSVGHNIVTSSSHKSIQDKYFKNYVNTGGDEFLTGSKYLLAGITMDGERIDLKQSINSNDIVMMSGFTIYANSSTALSLKPEEWWEKLFNSVKNFFSSDEKEMKDKSRVEGWETQELASSAKKMLNNLMVFIMDFFAELNETYNDVTFWMLLVVLPFTIFFGVQRLITKKVHEHQHQDDIAERLFLGIIIFFFFYIGQTTYKIDADKNIDQSQFQNSSRFLLYKGIDWADEATRAMAKAYVSFKIKDAGIIGRDNSKKLEYEINIDSKRRKEIYTILKDKCFEYYDTSKIMKNYHIGNDQHFTPDTNIYDYDYFKPQYKGIERKTTYEVKNIPTVNACYHLKREHQILNTKIAKAIDKINEFDAAVSSGGIEERINLIAEYIYKNTADNGFIAAPLIGTSNIFLDGIEAFSTEESKKSSANREESKIGENSLAIDSTLEWISNKSVYMMLSGAASLRESIYSLIKENDGGIVSSTLSLVMTIMIMMTMIKYAPILAMTSASILVIVFYYISVEVFYLVAPFIVVYAFASNQQQYIISLLGRFLALSLKPLMIVLSIALAMLAIKLFEGINTAIISVNFDMFQQVLNIDKFEDEWLSGKAFSADFFDSISLLGITFIGSIAKLLVQIFATLGVFYIVFNGAEMFIKMLGFRESGIDIQESVGREIDNGSSKYNRPV